MAPLLLAALPAIFDTLKGVIDKVIPDKAAAEKAKTELDATVTTQEFQAAMAQIGVNTEEAKSGNWFVAGWRPFVGWTCGAALAYVAIFDPIARFFAQVVFGYTGAFPVIDTSLTMQVLVGMLGLAGIRGYEKTKGVAR